MGGYCMIRNAFLLTAPAVALFLAGCNSQPVYEVSKDPVVATRAVQMAEVEKAIVRAGTGLSWQMQPQGPGKIQGTIQQRTHRAVVDISYDTKTFSIKYRDSTNLKYDGASIHKQYNIWIRNLERAITVQLSAI